MMSRCGACGIFFEGDACPNDHSDIPEYVPPKPLPDFAEMRGRVVGYSGMVCVIVDNPDEEGLIGLSPLHPRVRVNPDDVERID